MKKGFAIGAVVFGVIALAACILIVLTMRSYVKAFEWDVHEHVTDGEREKLSCLALMPEVSDDIEYYAVMGARDPSFLITSHSYGSVDDMCKALPEGCEKGIRNALEKGEYKETEDVLNRMTKRYDVSPDDLPLVKEDEVKKEYYAAARGAFRYYYVLEYEDGTYRFEMRVDEV
ncbi:MAG: hypothetical protein J5623_00240 [Clostridiales bacterium]|nr:hypothetical protein [Clostridiales bacterium]